MKIDYINIISLLIALISFNWALIERSKRKPLWWILKGLEQGAMSNLTLYDELRKKYSTESKREIPIGEVIAQIDSSYGHWRSHWELIKGIRYSVDSKIETKEEREKV